MQILNTLTVLALVVMSFALIVAVPVLYASNEDSGRSNRLILLGGIAWVALVLTESLLEQCRSWYCSRSLPYQRHVAWHTFAQKSSRVGWKSSS